MYVLCHRHSRKGGNPRQRMEITEGCVNLRLRGDDVADRSTQIRTLLAVLDARA
jgi:hypothetical protein